MSWYKIKITPEDRAWSEYIRKKSHGVCQFCGRPKGWKRLQNCHFHGRAKKSVRFDESNCDAGCPTCHKYMDEHKDYYRRWKLTQLGEQVYARLALKAQTVDRRLGSLWTKEFIKQTKEQIAQLDKKGEYI